MPDLGLRDEPEVERAARAGGRRGEHALERRPRTASSPASGAARRQAVDARRTRAARAGRRRTAATRTACSSQRATTDSASCAAADWVPVPGPARAAEPLGAGGGAPSLPATPKAKRPDDRWPSVPSATQRTW